MRGGRTLFRMTRHRGTGARAVSRSGEWALQDAEARFSEVVRKAKTEGPQRITVDGKDEVVVVSVSEYRGMREDRTGEALVKVLSESPFRDEELEPKSTRNPVRGVEL